MKESTCRINSESLNKSTKSTSSIKTLTAFSSTDPQVHSKTAMHAYFWRHGHLCHQGVLGAIVSSGPSAVSPPGWTALSYWRWNFPCTTVTGFLLLFFVFSRIFCVRNWSKIPMTKTGLFLYVLYDRKIGKHSLRGTLEIPKFVFLTCINETWTTPSWHRAQSETPHHEKCSAWRWQPQRCSPELSQHQQQFDGQLHWQAKS